MPHAPELWVKLVKAKWYGSTPGVVKRQEVVEKMCVDAGAETSKEGKYQKSLSQSFSR
jgi:hypothetical protein